MSSQTFRPSAQEPLLILAMDHRASFGKSLFGVRDDQPDAGQVAAMQAAKRLIYSGLARTRAQQPGGRAGVLVDERYGQQVIEAAHSDGVVLAIPVEHSGRDWFELEWGGDWLEHVRSNRPDFAKVLVRDNPAFPAAQRTQQLRALRQVSDALGKLGVPLLYELLVPATDEQRAAASKAAAGGAAAGAAGGEAAAGGTAADGAADAYDRDLRPDLVIQVIADNQAAGVEPAIWKVEGLETTEAARAVVARCGPAGAAMSARSCSAATLPRRGWTTG